jgi:hypothetical protein
VVSNTVPWPPFSSIRPVAIHSPGKHKNDNLIGLTSILGKTNTSGWRALSLGSCLSCCMWRKEIVPGFSIHILVCLGHLHKEQSYVKHIVHCALLTILPTKQVMWLQDCLRHWVTLWDRTQHSNSVTRSALHFRTIIFYVSEMASCFWPRHSGGRKDVGARWARP